jgi:ribosomal protein L24E
VKPGRCVVAASVCALVGGLSTVAAAGAPAPGDANSALRVRVARVARAHSPNQWTPGPGATHAAPSGGAQALAASPSVSVSDATGDVSDARDDVVLAQSGADTQSSVFTLRVQTPTNPLTDGNWVGDTGPVWVIDSNFNRVIDYIAALFLSDDGTTIIAAMFDGSITPVCTGSATYDGVKYIARFAGSCPRFRSYQWSSEMDYDLTPGGPSGDELIDYAPETTPSQPTPLHRLGYWMLGGDGKLYDFGSATRFASNVPFAAALTARRDGTGAWVVDLIGAVHAHGTATYKGGRPPLRANEIVTTMSATPTGKGYWLFTNRGRAFRYGDARLFGDLHNIALTGPIVASVATPDGRGYYMVGSDGGIFAFGNARFHGSMGGQRLDGRIVGIAPTPDGRGYWLVGEDGGVFAFGGSKFRGSMGGIPLTRPVNGLVSYGNGYLMVASDGGVFDFSNRAFLGSLGGRRLSAPIIGIAAFST